MDEGTESPEARVVFYVVRMLNTGTFKTYYLRNIEQCMIFYRSTHSRVSVNPCRDDRWSLVCAAVQRLHLTASRLPIEDAHH